MRFFWFEIKEIKQVPMLFIQTPSLVEEWMDGWMYNLHILFVLASSQLEKQPECPLKLEFQLV